VQRALYKNESVKKFSSHGEKYPARVTVGPRDGAGDQRAVRHLHPHHAPHLPHRLQLGSVLGRHQGLCPPLDDGQQYRRGRNPKGCVSAAMDVQSLLSDELYLHPS